MVVLFYAFIGLVVQSGGQHPPQPRPPYAPLAELPINDNIWILVAIGLITGVHFAIRRLRTTNKAS